MTFTWTQISTPIGPLLLAVTERGLVSVCFHARYSGPLVERLAERLLTEPVEAPLPEIVAQFEAYFAGELHEFTVPLDWSLSSGFNRRVLEQLHARVSYGAVASYGDLAGWVGEPGAAQAVGAAMGSNPLPVIVPCHRVVNSNGDLGGFGGGLETKRQLLALEGVLPAPLF